MTQVTGLTSRSVQTTASMLAGASTLVRRLSGASDIACSNEIGCRCSVTGRKVVLLIGFRASYPLWICLLASVTRRSLFGHFWSVVRRSEESPLECQHAVDCRVQSEEGDVVQPFLLTTSLHHGVDATAFLS